MKFFGGGGGTSVAELTTNYDLAKAQGLTLVKERSQTVTLDTGEFQIHDLQLVESKLFGSTRTTPGKLIRFNNLEDLTDRTAITFDADGFHDQAESLIYISDKQKLYVLFNNATRILVSEVDLVTLAVTDVINDTGRVAGASGDMASDGTHLYIATYASPSKVVKYQLSDFAFVAENTLTGLNQAHCATYDGSHLYVGGSTTPAWVAKVNPADLTFTSVTWPTGVGSITHPGFASRGDYLWVGTETTVGPWLWRLDKEALTLESFGVDGPTVAAIYYDGTWVWAALSSDPGKLVRVDPHTGAMAVHTFASGENHAYAMASDEERLFIVFWDPNPAIVKRLVPPALPSVRVSADARVGIGTSATTGSLIAVRNVEHVTIGNDTGSEKTLGTAALTANTLSADKKALRVTASGKFAANANAKRILVKFGLGAPVVVFDTGSLAFNGLDWSFVAYCVRTGANAQDWVTVWTCGDTLLAARVQHATSTQTDTSAVNVLVRGVGVAANDVTNEFLLVEAIN